MSDLLLQAPPVSRAYLEQIAGRVRSMMGITHPRFPVAEFLEFAFPVLMPRFTWEVRTKEEMENRHGLVDPHRYVLFLRDDVYDGMCSGKGRDRFTVCHELAHAILHTDMPLNRVLVKPKPYQCPEWQANTFASLLLMPAEHMGNLHSVGDAATRFGVTPKAAEVRLRMLNLRLPQFHFPAS